MDLVSELGQDLAVVKGRVKFTGHCIRESFRCDDPPSPREGGGVLVVHRPTRKALSMTGEGPVFAITVTEYRVRELTLEWR